MDNLPQAVQSVPPPGWTAAPQPAPVPPAAVAVAGTSDAAAALASVHEGAAEAAVRWRISAAILDNLIVYGDYLLLCAALGWRVAQPAHLLVLLLFSFLYHFVFESQEGQTLGKRRFGIRVIAADGMPASTRAVAIRSALRVIDQLPVLYVSGLVSMIRTGPARRQRIGDVAAGTIVVAVDRRAVVQGTPGWMLPAATLAAVVASAISAFAAFHSGNQQITAQQASRFIAGCNMTAGQVVDCQCVLSELEIDGYTTQTDFERLFAEERTALATDDRTALPGAVVQSVRSCRR